MISQRQLEIKTFCEGRRITALMHFTRLDNLKGILREGLICRRELEARAQRERPTFNDRWRAPWYRNSNCLSISSPDYRMFYLKQRKFPLDKWIVLEFDSSLLWELDCAFCITNAWSYIVQRTPIEHLKAVISLESLFGENTGNSPIDIQAEVLVFDRIEPENYLRRVYFKTHNDHLYWRNHIYTGGYAPPVSVDRFYF